MSVSHSELYFMKLESCDGCKNKASNSEGRYLLRCLRPCMSYSANNERKGMKRRDRARKEKERTGKRRRGSNKEVSPVVMLQVGSLGSLQLTACTQRILKVTLQVT